MASANAGSLTNKLATAYLGTGAYKALLVSSLPSESDLDTFVNRSSIANEVAASGTYAAGGAAVTMSVGAYDATNNRTPVTIGNPAAWTGATISAVGMWVYKVIGTAATDELVCFIDFLGTITSTASTFTATVTAPLYVNR